MSGVSEDMRDLLKRHQSRMDGLMADDARNVERLAKVHARAIYLHSMNCLPDGTRHEEIDRAILDELDGEEESGND